MEICSQSFKTLFYSNTVFNPFLWIASFELRITTYFKITINIPGFLGISGLSLPGFSFPGNVFLGVQYYKNLSRIGLSGFGLSGWSVRILSVRIRSVRIRFSQQRFQSFTAFVFPKLEANPIK